MNRVLKDILAEEAIRDLQNLAPLLLPQLEPVDPELRDRIEALGSRVSSRITLVGSDGSILADSQWRSSEVGALEYLSRRPEVGRALEEGESSGMGYDPVSLEYSAFYALRLPGSREILVLSKPLEPSLEIARRMRSAFLLQGFFALGLGLVLVWMVFGRLAISILRLSDAARRITAGEFIDEIPVSSRDEVGDLARGMEEMSSRLRHQLEMLKSEQDYLSTILNSMREGVMVTDSRGRITATNPAFRSTLDVRMDPIGRRPIEVIRHVGLSEVMEDLLKGAAERGLEFSFERRVFRAHFAAIETKEEVSGVVVVFHDITELRRLEGLQKDFVSNVSHELKTPLTSIQGFAETLLQEEGFQDIHRRFLERIFENAGQLSATIEQLLNLARLERGQAQFRWTVVRFSELIGSVEAEFNAYSQGKNLEFHCLNKTGEDSFWAGEGYITTVFRNLVENAAKYTERGTVTVTMDSADGELLFSVQDSGVGIPEDELEKVFERFHRVDKARGRVSGGSGIGLAIVKHIVQLHGGRVWATSRLGQGTTVSFTIPQRNPARITQVPGG
jgi:two-component system phosphate regulon sensor histidine kinase PhoR